MLSNAELEELKVSVQNYYSTGSAVDQSGLLATWFRNPDYFLPAKILIESSPDDIHFIHFIVLSYSNLLEYVYTSWTPTVFLENADWCLKIIMAQIDRFISTPIIARAFCTMYATLVMLGWHVSDELNIIFNDENFNKFSNGSSAQWYVGIRLYTAIVEKMSYVHHLETKQIQIFKEYPLLQCFNFAIKTLNSILNKTHPQNMSAEEISLLIQEATQLTTACLSFDAVDTSNIEKFNIVLPTTWDIIGTQSQMFVGCFFKLIEMCAPNVQIELLNVIFLCSAIHSDVKSRIIPDRIKYTIPFFNNITKMIGNNQKMPTDENIPTIINIILKIVISISNEDYVKVEKLDEFVQSVHSLTLYIFNIEFLKLNPESIINILKFWEKVSLILTKSKHLVSTGTYVEMSDMRKLKKMKEDEVDLEKLRTFEVDDVDMQIMEGMILNFCPMIESVCKEYISLLITLIQQDPNSAYEVLFSDLSQTNPLMTLIISIGKINGPQFFQEMLNSFNELLSSYQRDPKDKDTEMKLCLFTLIISRPAIRDQTVSTGDQINPMTNHIQSIIGILNLFTITFNLIIEGNVSNILMEKIILFLISLFFKSSYLRSDQTLPVPVQEATPYKSVIDLHRLFVNRIILLASTFYTNTELIEDSMKTLNQWTGIKRDFISNNLCGIFISEFLKVYDTALARCFDEAPTKHARVQFHQIIGQVLCDNPENQNFNPFFQGITARYDRLQQMPDEGIAMGLILDIRGILQGISLSQAYVKVFRYICPMLQIFHLAAIKYLSLVNPYLKLLSEVTMNKKARISFPAHSAEGLMLAKIAMNFVIVFFINAPKNLDQSYKGIFYCVQIMDNILTNSYSNLGALIAYEDPILEELFKAFLNFAHIVNFGRIEGYPSLFSQMIKLLSCLFQNFSEYIFRIDVTFVKTALIICTFSEKYVGVTDVENTFNVISEITDFCVRCMEKPDGQVIYENTKDEYNLILKMLGNMILKMPIRICFENSTAVFEQLIKLTKCVLRMKPSIWPEIRQKLALFLRLFTDENVLNVIQSLISIE